MLPFDNSSQRKVQCTALEIFTKCTTIRVAVRADLVTLPRGISSCAAIDERPFWTDPVFGVKSL
jgi:hypothetical protein